MNAERITTERKAFELNEGTSIPLKCPFLEWPQKERESVIYIFIVHTSSFRRKLLRKQLYNTKRKENAID